MITVRSIAFAACALVIVPVLADEPETGTIELEIHRAEVAPGEVDARVEGKAVVVFEDEQGNRTVQELEIAPGEALPFVRDLAGPEGAEFDPQVMRERIRRMQIERMDADGDGEVSDAERDAHREQMAQRVEAWRQRMQERREQIEQQRLLREWDANGDGILSDTEKQAMDAALAEREAKARADAEATLAMYDADGDGELSHDEIDAMQAKVKELTDPLAAIETLIDRRAEGGDRSLAEVQSTIRQYKYRGPARAGATAVPLQFRSTASPKGDNP